MSGQFCANETRKLISSDDCQEIFVPFDTVTSLKQLVHDVGAEEAGDTSDLRKIFSNEPELDAEATHKD